MKRRPLALAVTSLLAMGLGCQAEASHLSWNSLTEEEVESALEKPTGTLRITEQAAVYDEVQTRMPALLDASRFVASVMGVVIDVSENDQSTNLADLPQVTEGPKSGDQAWGTSLYLRVACPGDFNAPVDDFSQGEIRIDSPALTTLELLDLRQGGEFLFSFAQCHFGKTTLDARVPGRYLVDVDRLGFFTSADPDDHPVAAVGLDLGSALEEVEGQTPIGVVAFACGGKGGACHQDFRFAAEFLSSATGSYVVKARFLRDYWSRPQELKLEVQGATFTSSCTYSRDGILDCT